MHKYRLIHPDRFLRSHRLCLLRSQYHRDTRLRSLRIHVPVQCPGCLEGHRELRSHGRHQCYPVQLLLRCPVHTLQEDRSLPDRKDIPAEFRLHMGNLHMQVHQFPHLRKAPVSYSD